MTRPVLDLIEWLGGSGAGAEALGGKGASLDRLAKLGYRVPPGFCITTRAFRAHHVSGTERPADAALEPALAAALGDALDRLVTEVAVAVNAPPSFAVRSSAIGEDGAVASYAGLHATELGVAPADVPAAVRRCWASLWSPAARAYRTRRGLGGDDAAMAVVVQALIPADGSAVVFTRHPVTGRDDQLVITAARGLGDAMVSGTITPDTYVVDRSMRAVVSFDPGDDSRGPALQAAELAELVELSLAVEAGYGRAVDIEAAIAGGAWFLLQARPITTGGVTAAPAPTAGA